MTPRELAHRADVGAAAASEHERPSRQLPARRGDLGVERVLGDDGCLGPRQLEQRRLASSPRPRHPTRAARGAARLRTRGRTNGTGTRSRWRPPSACGSRGSGRAARSCERSLEHDGSKLHPHTGPFVEALGSRVALRIDSEPDAAPAAAPEAAERIGEQGSADAAPTPVAHGEEPRHPAHAKPLGHANGARDDLAPRSNDGAEPRIEVVVLEVLAARSPRTARASGSSDRQTRASSAA